MTYSSTPASTVSNQISVLLPIANAAVQGSVGASGHQIVVNFAFLLGVMVVSALAVPSLYYAAARLYIEMRKNLITYLHGRYLANEVCSGLLLLHHSWIVAF